jgi:hypothetical protein
VVASVDRSIILYHHAEIGLTPFGSRLWRIRCVLDSGRVR